MRAEDAGVVQSVPEELGKGTGLGLAIVYGIVKQKGINLGLERARSRRKFQTVFPRDGSGEPTIRTPADLSGQADGQTILVVEDDATIRANRRALPAASRIAHWKVAQAPLAACDENPGKTDLADLVMPGLDGHELTAQLGEPFRENAHPVYIGIHGR